MSLRQRLGRQFTVTAELDPPRSADPGSTYRQAVEAKDYVHAVNISDSPMANLRMSPIALAYLVQVRAELETIFHLTCRDRNVLGLQAELLGAAALGVKNILTLTGDPPARGDHPEAQGVFEVTVVELIEIAHNLNQGKTRGRDLETATDFTIAAAANPGAKDLELELAKFQAKLAAGANFFQTQPVFSAEEVLRFQDACGGQTPAPVLYGILPVRSAKMARNVAKWCNVPTELIDELEREGESAGLRWAKNTVAELKALGVAGVHVYPLSKTRILKEVLEPTQNYACAETISEVVS